MSQIVEAPIKLVRKERRALESVKRRKRYVTKEITIQEFLDNNNIDTNPIHQRPDSNDISKKRGIIESILSGIHIGIITLNDNGVDYIGVYRYESIDGGHRKRAILEFVEGKFKVYGLYFSEMSKEDRDFFLNTTLNFCEYNKLTNAEKGLVFRSLNTTTTMNDQEMRNSFGDTPIANLIRDIVRITPHKVFDYVQFDNKRLSSEELVARLVCMLNGDVPLATPAHSKDLFNLYENESLDEDCVKTLEGKLNKQLNFIMKMAKIRAEYLETGTKTKLGKKEFTLYSRVYFYCQEVFGKNFVVKDYVDFFKAINSIYSKTQLTVKQLSEEEEYSELLTHHPELPILDEDKGVAKQFNSSLSEFQGEAQLRYCVTYLEIFGLDFSKHIQKERTHRDEFSQAQKNVKLSEQDYRCGVTNEKLAPHEFHAGHKVSVKNGGTNKLSNLIMIRADINLDMGSMNYDDYMVLYNNREEGLKYVHMLKGKND